MADMVFPSQNAIGKRINFTYTNETHYVQIVGVVANENVDSLDAPPTPIVYDCYEQDPGPYFSLVVRTKQEPASLAAVVTRAVHELEPEAPIFKVSSMAQIISTAPAMIVRAYPAYLIGGFSALALLLAHWVCTELWPTAWRNARASLVCEWPWERSAAITEDRWCSSG